MISWDSAFLAAPRCSAQSRCGVGIVLSAPLYYGTGDHLNGKGIGVRTDLLDNAGFDYSNLQSMDDLYAMFAALKEQNPEKFV